MKLKIFSIYDTKAAAYQRPFFMPNAAMATRVFSDLANDSTHPVGQHPEDYTLYLLGEFDDNTAFITSKTKQPLATALELKSLQQLQQTNEIDTEEQAHQVLEEARDERVKNFLKGTNK